jgi:hypothetical protein
MTEVLFISWMIAGTVLSFILLAITKQPILSAIAGFLMGPVLPIILIYAAISTYAESKD